MSSRTSLSKPAGSSQLGQAPSMKFTDLRRASSRHSARDLPFSPACEGIFRERPAVPPGLPAGRGFPRAFSSRSGPSPIRASPDV
ncbi:MAG: hypothetical protein LBT40_15510 [Deltaproteobacteria bacterium]|nr:hypothetical protein [Deltaproteobacteria bacterium]